MQTGRLPIAPTGSTGEDGIWRAVRRDGPAGRNGPALFLDRDGIINEDTGYVHRLDDLRILPGASDLVRAANRRGIPTIVVTNQSGIGRGYYGWPEFVAFQTEIERLLAGAGAWLDAVFACPFHRDGVPPFDVDDHPARKPNPGMLSEGGGSFDVDMRVSWIIGDRGGDMVAGARAGLQGGILVGDRPADDMPPPFDLRTAASPVDALALVPLFSD